MVMGSARRVQQQSLDNGSRLFGDHNSPWVGGRLVGNLLGSDWLDRRNCFCGYNRADLAPATGDSAVRTESNTMTALSLWGAGAFGVVIGWFVYYINRYRTGDVQLSDIVTLVGAAVLAIFPAGTSLFGAYGIGLAAGFFAYFVVLLILVGRSKEFDWDFFLDGRRKIPGTDYYISGGPPMQRPL